MVEEIYTGKLKKEENDKIFQFIPKDFLYLTDYKKLKYKNLWLKTDYLINIINELVMKYFLINEIKFNLWSIVLKKKYGKHYNYYFQYLVDNKFIFLVSNYYVGKKSKTYKINIDYLKNFTRVKIKDKILIRKYKDNFLSQSFLYFNKSPIDVNIREKLVNDLYSVNIDYEKACNYIINLKESNDIEDRKYIKNLNSIESIKNRHIFFKFDTHGRMHTNFTILKKEIRRDFLTIDNQETSEIDLKNSQPFFLSKLIKEEFNYENLNSECKNFIDLSKNGLIYDEMVEKSEEIPNRNEAKLLIYKILFGFNNNNKKEDQIFKNIFPTVYEYILELKSLDNSYKEMSHKLQKMESHFIFNKVIRSIKDKKPEIKMFTIHDSIVFPKKYKAEVSTIFNYFLKKEL